MIKVGDILNVKVSTEDGVVEGLGEVMGITTIPTGKPGRPPHLYTLMIDGTSYDLTSADLRNAKQVVAKEAPEATEAPEAPEAEEFPED